MTFDDLYRAFLQTWQRSAPGIGTGSLPPMEVPILVACSAGGDSVALLRLMHRWWQDSATAADLGVAHFNHGLREHDSDEDERFVRELCRRLQLPCHVESPGVSCDPVAIQPGESHLRDLRRSFFLRTANSFGYRYVLTAHTQDDQIETVLFRLFRGSGPTGLAGIPAHSCLGTDVVLKRPLLAITRQQLRDCLREIGQTWREDDSNEQTNYARNHLRHEVWPRIEERFPQAGNAIARFASLAEEQTSVLRGLGLQWLNQKARFDQHTVWFDRDQNDSTAISVLVLACQIAFDRMQWSRGKMSHTHWQQLAKAIQGEPEVGSFQLPGRLHVAANQSGVVISNVTTGP
ncbi:MAG: tRNA lysidine(34) synthetase TilS [Planctomycetota bacterium]